MGNKNPGFLIGSDLMLTSANSLGVYWPSEL